MKKNISINISGIIFHIEEDGYEHLKKYLESINQYFTSYDDSDEIIADIEGRIAEIFLSKLNEGKQVITHEDVESLMTTMGSVRDFQSIEEPEEEYQEQTESKKSTTQTSGEKRLYRDSNRKILGGVSAGLAHYFGVDPLWIRLAFVLVTAGTGIALIAYIVMWVVIPESDDIQEDSNVKKMYRNPENRVLGGVAGGVAAYFGIEVAYIRLFWVLSILFFGTGIMFYIILWLILPEAKSITEKVQMKGDPVTLSNIESNIKKELNVEEDKEESVFVKIILFPFRLIATIIKGFGKVFGSLFRVLFEVVRIAFGLLLTVVGVSTLFSLVVAAGALLGLFASSGFFGMEHVEMQLPFLFIQDGFPTITVIAAFLAAAIPAFFVIVIGVSIMAKTRVLAANVGWALFGVWIFGLIGLSFTVPSMIMHFNEDGYYKETETYDLQGKTAVLTLFETGEYEDYEVVRLQLRGHDSDEFKLAKEFESRGRNRRDAIENAKGVSYNVELENDSVLVFDSNISFRSGTPFRGQDLDMILYIPYDQPFKMSYSLREIMYNTIYRSGYDVNDMDLNNTWIFTPAGLECITCDKSVSSYDEDSYSSRYGTSRIYDFTNFSSLEVGSAFELIVSQGEQYKVVLYGDEDTIDKIRLIKDGDLLDIRYGRENYNFNSRSRKNVKVKITMPAINDIKASGASKVYVNGFDGSKLSIDLSGASYGEVDGDFEDVNIQLEGASELELKGSGKELRADISGSSELNAYNYMVNFATVEASGISKSNLYVTERLEVESSVVSNVKYRGEAELISNISEED